MCLRILGGFLDIECTYVDSSFNSFKGKDVLLGKLNVTFK